jgi:3'-5' exoribonuclease 1
MAVVDDIREKLKQLGLDTRGNKSTLKQRLRKYLKDTKSKDNNSRDDNNNDSDNDDKEGAPPKPQKLSGVKQHQQQQQKTPEQEGGQSQRKLHKNSRYDYYLCFDVEATCELGFRFEFPSEVIEFPIVLLDGSTLEIVSRALVFENAQKNGCWVVYFFYRVK